MPPLGTPLRLRGQDQPLYLRLDINAMARIETAADKGLQLVLERGMVVSALRLVLWAGARSAEKPDRWRGETDPAWTPDAAGDALQGHLDGGGTVEGLSEELTPAIDAALGKRDPRPAPASPAAPAPDAPPGASPTG